MKKNPMKKGSTKYRNKAGANMKQLGESKKTYSKVDRNRLNSKIEELKAELKLKNQELRLARNKLKEYALQEHEHQMNAFVNGSPIPQFVIGRDHRILYWNRAMEALSGIKAGEVVGTKQHWRAFYDKKRPTLADLLIDGDEGSLTRWFDAKYNNSKYIAEAYEATDYFPKLGGKGLWLSFTAALIKDTRGTVIGAVETLEDITDHKRMEEALLKSEERFRQVAESTEEWIWEVDSDGLYTYANSVVEEILGYRPEEIVGKMHFYDFFIPDSREEMKKAAFKYFKEKKAFFKFVNLNAHKNGGKILLETSGIPILNNKGRLLGYRGVDINITARKRAEEALKQERIFTDAVLDSVPGLLYLYDDEGHLRRWNKGHEIMTGYTSKELDGMHVLDWFKHDEQDAARIKAAVERAFKEGHASAEGKLMKKNGKKIPYYFTATLLEIQGRKYFTGIGIDITERRLAEEALRESQIEYRDLVENANSIILRIDTEGTVTFFNEFAQNFFGYSSGEIMGKNVIGTIVPETDSSGKDMGQFIRDIARYPEKYKNNENENIKKNGELVWVSWTNKIIQDKTGKVKEILCIGNDITEHKRSEDALRKSEIKYRELTDFLPEIVFELDINGNITYANRVAYTLLGYTLDELTKGLNILEILVPEDRERGWTIFKNILKGERSTGNEYTILKKDGPGIPIMVHARAIIPDGTITGVRGIIVDITDRKIAEVTLRESEEKFRRLFQDSGIAQFLFDGNKIIDCNVEALNMMGCWDKNQLIDKFIHDFSPGIQADGVSSIIKGRNYAKLALQVRSLTFEWQYRRLDGGLFTAEIVMTAIPMAGKDILHANLRDITERKRLQNEIINIIDIEQQRLGQNLHDGLGQDLTGIAFMCNTLAKKLRDMQLPEAALSEEITKYVYNIITRVRMLSRELYPPNLVENEITYTLQQFASNISSLFNISCTFNQDTDLVISDIFISTQIYYIVREAVNNSIKHGQAKNILISLTHNKNDVIFVIKDDGIGQPEMLDKYKGLGLRIMAYRIGTLNGTFTILGNNSGGVIILCTFPKYKIQKDH
jgi:PAS domain S-box-containing protein